MLTSKNKRLSVLIKKKAINLGFNLCGIAPSRSLNERENVLRNWCSSGMNGEMSYLGKNIEKRINPEFLVPGAKSVIVTGLNYYTDKKQAEHDVPVISRYAYGINYHDVIKRKLDLILKLIRKEAPEMGGCSFVDSAPVLEKAWAVEAGLGWQGRHSIVINNKIGSFFFIGIIVLDIELDYDKPFRDNHCGSCRLCVELCPTGAINENGTIDTRKCIANLTIENRAPIPEEIIPKMERRVYGCDKCQEVCPWNKNAKSHKIPEFELSAELEFMTVKDWKDLSREEFKRLFNRSSIARRKYDPFMRNVTIVTNFNN
ncbi:MAG: tRNA epoxyqueuosine(34) reductase QueG [Bacteroidales bacterium]